MLRDFDEAEAQAKSLPAEYFCCPSLRALISLHFSCIPTIQGGGISCPHCPSSIDLWGIVPCHELDLPVVQRLLNQTTYQMPKFSLPSTGWRSPEDEINSTRQIATPGVEEMAPMAQLDDELKRPPYPHSMLAGGIGGTSGDILMHSLDTVKTRQQGDPHFPPKYISLSDSYVKIFRQEGVKRGLYGGFTAAMLGSFPGTVIFFGDIRVLQTEHARPWDKPLSVISDEWYVKCYTWKKTC